MQIGVFNSYVEELGLQNLYLFAPKSIWCSFWPEWGEPHSELTRLFISHFPLGTASVNILCLWFANEYKGLKERSTFFLIFVVPRSSFCWCPSIRVSYCLTQSHSTSQEEQGRLPWFSVFLRTPEPYFGEVSHLHAVSVPLSVLGDSLLCVTGFTRILCFWGILGWV